MLDEWVDEMTEEVKAPKFCAECKHFEYDNNQAHKNRCKRFPDENGSVPVALVRSGACGNGEAWEPK